MNTVTEKTTVEIDATGKRLGRLATEVATVLMGKNSPDFAKHTVHPVQVKVLNASKMDIPEGKKAEIYQSYSGYPGGLSKEKLAHLADRLGYAEVFRRSVKNMLPKNKLQKQMMLNLEVTE